MLYQVVFAQLQSLIYVVEFYRVASYISLIQASFKASFLSCSIVYLWSLEKIAFVIYLYYSIPLRYIPSYELCPQKESNLHLSLRTGLLYPLSYEGNCK